MSAVNGDYYEVLGVSRDADEETIREAFHALARECHPDVARAPEAEQRFRRLAEAYSVLSKREARHLYDQYGYRGRGNQMVDEALLEREWINQGEDVYIDLELRAFEATEGTRRLVVYPADVRCDICRGGGFIGQPDPDCPVCEGTGQRTHVTDIEAAHILQIANCPACGSETCPRCHGSGIVAGERRLRLLIPAGVEDCAQLRVRGEGHFAGLASVPGNLRVHVRVQPEPRDPRVVRYLAFVLLLVAVAALVFYIVSH